MNHKAHPYILELGLIGREQTLGISIVMGAGGFIGSHLAKRLKADGHTVIGTDLKNPEFSKTHSDHFVIGDLREKETVKEVIKKGLELRGDSADRLNIYQLAADMGGAGFVFSGENDADIMHNSALINLNLLEVLQSFVELGEISKEKMRIFYSSSACIYPEGIQMDAQNVDLPESAAYPAEPDSEYGWEKLFSERLFAAFNRNYGIEVRVARYHNIYGPEGTWSGGREKAPAAICRKVSELPDEGGEIVVWGDGKQTRSFLFIDDCIEATVRFFESDFSGPINIGSEEMVTISELVQLVARVANKDVLMKFDTSKPRGVMGRNSNNDLIRKKLNWDYQFSLHDGIKETFRWINQEVNKSRIG